MKNKLSVNMLKIVFPALLVFFLSSCTKELELNTPRKSQIVVHCLFTSDMPWNVSVYETFSLTENKPPRPINNALIEITSSTGELVRPEQKTNGTYVSGSYPETGTTYELAVEIEGHKKISAKSSVPYSSGLSGVNVNHNLQTVQSTHSAYSEMISADFSIAPPAGISTLCRVRSLVFDPVEGYKRYSFDDGSFKRMRELAIAPSVVYRLEILKGQIVFGPLWEFLIQLIGEVEASENIDKIGSATYLDEIGYRDPGAFSMMTCVAPAGMFYQVPYEDYTLLGQLDGEKRVKVYTFPFLENEYWLEFLDLSNEYYLFQKDYLLQLSNRGNLNAPPILVYSNIENGTGIFAGYQKQLIRLN